MAARKTPTQKFMEAWHALDGPQKVTLFQVIKADVQPAAPRKARKSKAATTTEVELRGETN